MHPFVQIELLPGGLTVASGGTRTTIKLDRPWQPDIVVRPETCPFDHLPPERHEFVRLEEGGGWRVIDNRYTPFEFHRLIIPFLCWPKEDVRCLGGKKQIERVLHLLSDIHAVERRPLWLTVHIGALAGQNIPHLHFHVQALLEISPFPDEVATYVRAARPEVEVFSDADVRVIAAGHRAGQCLIASHQSHELFETQITSVATALDQLIRLFAEKFKSSQGLPPDFMFLLALADQRMRFASYVPILNQQGGPEFLALLERTSMIIPWSHEITAAHLRAV